MSYKAENYSPDNPSINLPIIFSLLAHQEKSIWKNAQVFCEKSGMPISGDTNYNSNGKPIFFPNMIFCNFFAKRWWVTYSEMHIWGYNIKYYYIKHSQNKRYDVLKTAPWFWA